MMDLFMDAATENDGVLYFTACNTNSLYQMDLTSQKIDILKKLPVYTDKIRKFTALVFHDNMIWMIPRGEIFFLIFDLLTERIRKINVPGLIEINFGKPLFRKPVVCGSIMWLTENFTTYIIKVDMDAFSCEIINTVDWQVGAKKNQINIQNIVESNNQLFCFKNNCYENVSYDLRTGKITILPLKSNKNFGFVTDDRIYLAPKKYEEEIVILNKDNYEVKKTFSIDDEFKSTPEYYLYWYMKKIGDNVFFLPHEAKAMIIYDEKKDYVKCCRLNNERYRTLAEYQNGVALDDLFCVHNILIGIPYMGNEIFIFDKLGTPIGTINLTINEDYMEPRFKIFIDELCNQVGTNWNIESNTDDVALKEYLRLE